MPAYLVREDGSLARHRPPFGDDFATRREAEEYVNQHGAALGFTLAWFDALPALLRPAPKPEPLAEVVERVTACVRERAGQREVWNLPSGDDLLRLVKAATGLDTFLREIEIPKQESWLVTKARFDALARSARGEEPPIITSSAVPLSAVLARCKDASTWASRESGVLIHPADRDRLIRIAEAARPWNEERDPLLDSAADENLRRAVRGET